MNEHGQPICSKKVGEKEVENLGFFLIEKSKGFIETMNMWESLTWNFFCISLKTTKKEDRWGQNMGRAVSP